MFGRRRDIQIPKVPVSGDKATQSWMTAVGSMLSKYIGEIGRASCRERV